MYTLIGVGLIAAAATLWLRAKLRRGRTWNRLFREAAEAQQRCDLATAERQLDAAEALGCGRTGVFWRVRAQAVESLRMQVLYRAGQLDRARTLGFQQLSRAQAVT